MLAGACGDDSGSSDDEGFQAPPSAPPPTMLGPGQCASPGQRFSCECGAQRGFQTCDATMMLSACDCSAAMGLDMGQRGCDPTQPLRLTCMCADGRPGLRLCGDNGILQACDCDLPEFSDDADAGAGDQDAGR
jgi:hypothetical protein